MRLSHTVRVMYQHRTPLLLSYLFVFFVFTFAVPSPLFFFFFFLNDPAPTEISSLPLHAALPIWPPSAGGRAACTWGSLSTISPRHSGPGTGDGGGGCRAGCRRAEAGAGAPGARARITKLMPQPRLCPRPPGRGKVCPGPAPVGPPRGSERGRVGERGEFRGGPVT